LVKKFTRAVGYEKEHKSKLEKIELLVTRKQHEEDYDVMHA
jgi:hypothetical protein